MAVSVAVDVALAVGELVDVVVDVGVRVGAGGTTIGLLSKTDRPTTTAAMMMPESPITGQIHREREGRDPGVA